MSADQSSLSDEELTGLVRQVGDMRSMTGNEIRILRSVADAATQRALERAVAECNRLSAGYGGIAEGPIATDFGKAIHEAMAVGAKNCASKISALMQQPKENERG